MNCCTNCFESSYINDIILRNKVTGNCDYCKSKSIAIYDASELNIFFKGIIDLYEVDTDYGRPIGEQIVTDFDNKVFTNTLVTSGRVSQLIKDIIDDDIADYQEILSSSVRLKYYNSNVEEVVIKPLALSWDKFSEEIKTINRFHFVNALDLERLKSLFRHFEKQIPKGKKFYRARISNNINGHSIADMGNPPNHSAKSGRANPNGISYLYLANEVQTALYEVRASLFDYVSIGTFRLEENIRVINLSRTTYDVFRLAELESLEDVMIHGSFINKLETELSKPRRKGDSELDYLPTQYLSELIKSMGFDGIEYQSSLYTDGYNVAIFYPDKFRCIDVNIYDINNINLDYKKVNLI